MYFWIITLRQALKEPEARGALRSAIVLLTSGVIFYMLVEHWSFVDSLYFCVTTLTTVGFGNPAPTTDLGKLFTVHFVLSGVGMFLAVINGIGRAAVKNQVTSIGRRKGFTSDPSRLQDYVDPTLPDPSAGPESSGSDED